ncbi:unnamed protein product [Rangifer tarandus platyrhynchus]|uniref:Uncharacterized protein n=1 Tax=Rangifer tarandus platyrhynchus TaxID=3082113 RepID=A0AC60A5H1_RANTA
MRSSLLRLKAGALRCGPRKKVAASEQQNQPSSSSHMGLDWQKRAWWGLNTESVSLCDAYYRIPKVSLAVLGLCCGMQALHCRAGVLWFQPAGAALVAVHRRFMAMGDHIAERRLRKGSSLIVSSLHGLLQPLETGLLASTLLLWSVLNTAAGEHSFRCGSDRALFI